MTQHKLHLMQLRFQYRKTVKDIFFVHIRQKLIQWTDVFIRIKWFKIKFAELINKLRLGSYSKKSNSTGWGDPYLVEPNCSGRPLVTDFGCLSFWSVEILVANIAESMKRSGSKQLATYTLARSIWHTLLTGFAVQSLLT